MKKLRIFSAILITVFLLLSLIGCSNSKTLSSSEYSISNNGSSFTIRINDNNHKIIEKAKVTVKYKYYIKEYTNDSKYVTDFKAKTKTETFEIIPSSSGTGTFVGNFQTEHAASTFECKKVVVYYSENDSSSDSSNNGSSGILNGNSSGGFKDFVMDIIIAIGVSIGCFIIGLIIWFVLWTFFVNVNVALCIGCIPYVIAFFGTLIGGDWIPALIFLLGVGALVCLAQLIYNKMS